MNPPMSNGHPTPKVKNMPVERLTEHGVYKHTDKDGRVSYQIEKTCGALGTFWNLSLHMSEKQWQHIIKTPKALKLIHGSMHVTDDILELIGYPEEYQDEPKDEPDTAGPRTDDSQDPT